jgi:hypothetical protein
MGFGGILAEDSVAQWNGRSMFLTEEPDSEAKVGDGKMDAVLRDIPNFPENFQKLI